MVRTLFLGKEQVLLFNMAVFDDHDRQVVNAEFFDHFDHGHIVGGDGDGETAGYCRVPLFLGEERDGVRARLSEDKGHRVGVGKVVPCSFGRDLAIEEVGLYGFVHGNDKTDQKKDNYKYEQSSKESIQKVYQSMPPL